MILRGTHCLVDSSAALAIKNPWTQGAAQLDLRLAGARYVKVAEEHLCEGREDTWA